MYPDTVYDLDANANNCRYTVDVVVSPGIASGIVQSEGSFETHPSWF